MSESFLERLTKFTPEAGRLERDALIFSAGRASARPNRMWISLASALAGTQVLSLVLLWPGIIPDRGAGEIVRNLPPERGSTVASSESPLPACSDASSLWSARHSWMESETRNASAAEGAFVENGPPLRALSPAAVDRELTR